MIHAGVEGFKHLDWVKKLQEDLQDHDFSHPSLTFGSGVSIEGCIIIAAIVVEQMTRNPTTLTNFILRLPKHQQEKIRLLLNSLE